MDNENSSNVYKINTAFNANRIEMTEEFRGEPLVKQIVELRERAVQEALKRLGYVHPESDFNKACLALGPWMAAAMDDPDVCHEMRAAATKFIEHFPQPWMEADAQQIQRPS